MYGKNDYMSSFVTNTNEYYKKWVQTYKNHLLFLFKELLYQLKIRNININTIKNKENYFFNLIYQTSSKRLYLD